MIYEKLEGLLDMDAAFLSRYVNDGFSGGEKKRPRDAASSRSLAPKYAVLDERPTPASTSTRCNLVGWKSIEAMRATDDGKGTPAS